ncbi:hypothetical protein HYALB_00009988 [Hymenoscyphus albidus]|uniref:Uncharacterized protein n=1 Tax=Hymenoscyphus albidus TaxID=595503 RepID=A0A9N9Q0L2_9HELO|nr:hypothetical protein HYALB_00009988 [Hymenoscyphus albidus]
MDTASVNKHGSSSENPPLVSISRVELREYIKQIIREELKSIITNNMPAMSGTTSTQQSGCNTPTTTVHTEIATVHKPETFLVLAFFTARRQLPYNENRYETGSKEVIEVKTDMTITQVRDAILAHFSIPFNYRLVDFRARRDESDVTVFAESNVKNVLMGLKQARFAKVFVDVLVDKI